MMDFQAFEEPSSSTNNGKMIFFPFFLFCVCPWDPVTNLNSDPENLKLFRKSEFLHIFCGFIPNVMTANV
jgi:hypothetical protein